MLRSTINRIDAFWAERLDCPADDLREPHVKLVTHGRSLASYRGVYAFSTHDGGPALRH